MSNENCSKTSNRRETHRSSFGNGINKMCVLLISVHTNTHTHCTATVAGWNEKETALTRTQRHFPLIGTYFHSELIVWSSVAWYMPFPKEPNQEHFRLNSIKIISRASWNVLFYSRLNPLCVQASLCVVGSFFSSCGVYVRNEYNVVTLYAVKVKSNGMKWNETRNKRKKLNCIWKQRKSTQVWIVQKQKENWEN